MNKKDKLKICIIAHRYIPFSGVNGMRWINLSRELALLGYDVSIITVRRAGVERHDLTQGGLVKVFLTDSNFFSKVVEFQPNNFVEKLIKGALIKFTSAFIKDDYADNWIKQLDPVIKKYSEANPSAILIGTGAPFQACLHTSLLGRKYNLKTITDFQDPWFNDELSKVNIKLENYRESCYSYVANNSDIRVYVTTGLKKHYEDTASDSSLVIENAHGFYGVAVKDCESISSNKFLYLGTLANGRDSAFIEWITKLNASALIDEHIVIDVYGRVSERFKLFLKNNNTKIKVNLQGYVTQNEIKDLAKHYSAALQINANEYPYLVSTKIYEYPALGLPTLSINYGGDINSLIVENRIGFSEQINRPLTSLGKILNTLSKINRSDLDYFSKNNSWKSRAVEYSILLDNLSDDS